MSEFIQVWDESKLTGDLTPPPFSLPNTPGCSIKITNNSIYYLNLKKTATSTPVDALPPFSFLIFPNQPDLSLEIDTSQTPSTNAPDTQNVTFATMDGNVQYQHGSTTFNGQQNVAVSGDLNATITNSSLAVEVQGTPTFDIAPGASIGIAGTASVAIAGTPTVALSGTSNVNILNTPEVALASGASVNISGTPEVTLAAGTTVAITGTPTINIGNTPSVAIQGTPTVQFATGATVAIGNTPSVTFEPGAMVGIEGTPTVQFAAGASVEIVGTPQVNVANTSINVTNEAAAPLTIAGSVNIGNTPNVNIAGTPTVNIAENQTIAISGTPTVQFAAGTSIGIDVNANQIEIINQPGVTIENENITTDLGYGMTRDIGGGVFFAGISGITIIAFAELVQQVYLQNRGSADVYVTGDEDPSMSSQGVLLSSGDAIGLSWRTQHLYLRATEAQIPVQAQGFY